MGDLFEIVWMLLEIPAEIGLELLAADFYDGGPSETESEERIR